MLGRHEKTSSVFRKLPCLFPLLLLGCTTSGHSGPGTPPSTSGTHTVLGRAFFPGGVMVLMDAHLEEGEAYGRVEYSRVRSRGESTFRVEVDVQCVGLFQEGAQAIVAGPVSRVAGDYTGLVGPMDWWMIQVEEGGSEGDRILSQRESKQRALSLCQNGSNQAATLRAVDGDLSIL